MNGFIYFLCKWLFPLYDLSVMHFQQSFGKIVHPSHKELGLTDLVSIYSELCELGKTPVIIDAADLQQDPEVILL